MPPTEVDIPAAWAASNPKRFSMAERISGVNAISMATSKPVCFVVGAVGVHGELRTV
jgi:hypothetical protein